MLTQIYVAILSLGHNVLSNGIMLMWHQAITWNNADLLYPCFNEVENGYTGFTLFLCPSVGSIVSALYLQ